MEKKIEQQLPIQYVCQDMRELELYSTVDATICTLDSLNHLPGFEDVETVFRKVWEFTEPGGVFLFDMNTLYKHRELLGSQVYVYETGSAFCTPSGIESGACRLRKPSAPRSPETTARRRKCPWPVCGVPAGRDRKSVV